MKRFRNATVWLGLRTCTFIALVALLWPAGHAGAQGVTTGAISGVVTNEQQQPVAGASVIAIHLPSGTNYEATTRADGRFTIPGMRVGGPYSAPAGRARRHRSVETTSPCCRRFPDASVTSRA